MPQTLTDLFNNLGVASQPISKGPASFNGTISAPSSSVVSSSTQTSLPSHSSGPAAPQYNNGNVFIQPVPGIRSPIVNIETGQHTFSSLPAQAIPNSGVSIANPFRNTATTRIIG